MKYCQVYFYMCKNNYISSAFHHNSLWRYYYLELSMIENSLYYCDYYIALMWYTLILGCLKLNVVIISHSSQWRSPAHKTCRTHLWLCSQRGVSLMLKSVVLMCHRKMWLSWEPSLTSVVQHGNTSKLVQLLLLCRWAALLTSGWGSVCVFIVEDPEM